MSQFSFTQACADWPAWPAHLRDKPKLVRHLEGGSTNKSALIKVRGEHLVLRINADNADILDINREQERLFHSAAAEARLATDIIYLDPKERYSLTRFIEGETWALKPTLSSEMQLAEVAELFSRVHRLAVDTTVIDFNFKYMLYRQEISAKNPQLHQHLQSMDSALDNFWQRYADSAIHYCPCHHDAIVENIIDTGSELMLLDWEYAAISDPWFDLATFADSARLNTAQTELLIKHYRPQTASPGESWEGFNKARICARIIELCWHGAQGINTKTLDKKLRNLALSLHTL